jgi:acetoin utilization deacetylase AcuC-like enzyme
MRGDRETSGGAAIPAETRPEESKSVRSSPLSRLLRRVRPMPPVELWIDEAYRVPLPSVETAIGMEPRRVELAAWTLLDRGGVKPGQLRTPRPINFADVLRVHRPDYVESLHRADVLAPIFGVEPAEIAVEPLLQMVRLASGATLQAARSSLDRRAHALNLCGGFHHAAPARGAGFCALNDIAIAIAALRADGFAGTVVVLDLDAHPPDGTAQCLEGDRRCWIGSLSGIHWQTLPNVDEVVLPDRSGDAAYLAALGRLLRRMPAPDLAFVIAGGDVLDGDRLGRLGLSLRGTRKRDRRVARTLHGIPAVWLPGGGYHPDAWRVLTGTGLVLAGRGRAKIPRTYDPLGARFAAVAGRIPPETLHGDFEITSADVAGDLGHDAHQTPRLLGYYTASGLEYALYRQGIFGQLQRLGYGDLQVLLDSVDTGDRFRLFGHSNGERHLLIEVVVERRREGTHEFLFVNWLTLRNPRARFSPQRPQLPGQEVPGLGMGREATELLALMAKRLGLAGILIRPAWYHLAYAGRTRFEFMDPERHGRFEALMRDTAGMPLLDVTCAVAEGRAFLESHPYTWEATDFVHWLFERPRDSEWAARMKSERDRVRFAIEPRRTTSPTEK